MNRWRIAVLAGVGITIASGWRFAAEPSRLTLGALVLVALLTLGLAIGVLAAYRRGLEGAGARRRAMIDADIGWFADARIEEEDLRRLVGEKAADAPPTVALGLGEDGVEVWFDEFGRAGVLPSGTATVVSGRGTTQSLLVGTDSGPAGVELLGPFWGAVPAAHSAAVEAVMFLNGPYTPESR